MDEEHYRIVNSDIQWYQRPALGYQAIIFAREGNYLGIHPTLYTIIEYQYDSPYSYPARDEAAAREQAVSYCIAAIANHYSRLGKWAEARIYAFGGFIGAMRLVPRQTYMKRLIERQRSEV